MPQKYINLLKKELAPSGIDIIKPFNVLDYNKLCHNHPKLIPLPHFDHDNTLGLLIGNTKAIWRPFAEHYKKEASLKNSINPLDQYIERVISKAIEYLSLKSEIRYGFHDSEKFVSMLHVAELSGLAKISPVNLAVNSEYGFWFGLRAVVILDLDSQVKITSDDPCKNCPEHCKEAFDSLIKSPIDDDAQKWIAIRKSCPLGLEFQYSENQLNYHHIKTSNYIKFT